MVSSGKSIKATVVLVPALLLIGAGAGLFLRPCRASDIDLVLPEDLNAEFIVRFDGLWENRQTLLFDVDADGRPSVLLRHTLIAPQITDDKPPDKLRIAGVETIGDFAWMADGRLLLVAGKSLGELTEDGFDPILTLPDEHMKVGPASDNECYLYGGRNAKTRRNLYLYRKDGTLLHLLAAPEPITAVAGNREFTFLAIGTRIYLFSEGRPLLAAYSTTGSITSLAMSEPAGVFFSTTDSVGYVSEPGRGFSFIQGKGAPVQVRDDSLFLFFPDAGVMRCWPIWRFAKMAEDLQQAADKAGPSAGTGTQ
jgi:hypothetical protein